jgi:4-amino-4-deoxy-L-arabinose transferase-like glycosyltransferase
MKPGKWLVLGSRQVRLLAMAIVGAFLVLALAYSFAVPVWEAPDEINHFGYVRHVLETRTLPKQEVGVMMEAHHPPLYYVLAALAASPADLSNTAGAFRTNPEFGWGANNEPNASLHFTAETFPYRGQSLAVHLIRFVSVLMGAGTVALTIGIGWQIFPARPLVGLLAGVLAAFNPQFLFISGAINNDNLVVLATTGALWQTLRAMQTAEAWRQWFYVGVWLAVGMLAKSSAIVMLGVASAALAWCALSKGDLRMLVRNFAAIGAVVALGSGWWFVRNVMLYGDPLGWSALAEVYAATMRRGPLQIRDVAEFFRVQFRSFWGVFGWMTVDAPAWFYTAMKGLLVLAGAGLVLAVVRGRMRRLEKGQRHAILVLVAVLVGQELFLLASITRFDASLYQGRHLFPAIAPIALLMAMGVVALLQDVAFRWRLGAVAGLAAILCAIAIYMVTGVISPAYESATLPKKSVWLTPARLDATFGEMVSLRAYELERGEEGGAQTLVLYWQAVQPPDFNYSAFVHVVDAQGAVVYQVDGAPGEEAGYPLASWQAGDLVAERYELPAALAGRDGLAARVGLYNWMDGSRLPVSVERRPAGDAVTIGLGDG